MRVAETRTILAAIAAVLVAATGARSSDILWEETKRYSFGHEEVAPAPVDQGVHNHRRSASVGEQSAHRR